MKRNFGIEEDKTKIEKEGRHPRNSTRKRIPRKSQYFRMRCHFCRTQDSDRKYFLCSRYPACRRSFCKSCLKRDFRIRVSEIKPRCWVCPACQSKCLCEQCRDKGKKESENLSREKDLDENCNFQPDNNSIPKKLLQENKDTSKLNLNKTIEKRNEKQRMDGNSFRSENKKSALCESTSRHIHRGSDAEVGIHSSKRSNCLKKKKEKRNIHKIEKQKSDKLKFYKNTIRKCNQTSEEKSNRKVPVCQKDISKSQFGVAYYPPTMGLNLNEVQIGQSNLPLFTESIQANLHRPVPLKPVVSGIQPFHFMPKFPLDQAPFLMSFNSPMPPNFFLPPFVPAYNISLSSEQMASTNNFRIASNHMPIGKRFPAL